MSSGELLATNNNVAITRNVNQLTESQLREYISERYTADLMFPYESLLRRDNRSRRIRNAILDIFGERSAIYLSTLSFGERIKITERDAELFVKFYDRDHSTDFSIKKPRSYRLESVDEWYIKMADHAIMYNIVELPPMLSVADEGVCKFCRHLAYILKKPRFARVKKIFAGLDRVFDTSPELEFLYQ